ncbi:DMT family transporter [Halotalea alkalilenta]|uniref:DMT family transporter n=1 Tax=Halotalea alkalilenta TaxID=376489 RepID=UPI0004864CEF|nr:DMT family transporter [Halotalea alkalilenta]
MTAYSFSRSAWAARGAMASFVLLWGSAAIFTHWGLEHASALVLLILRFVLALFALGLMCLKRRAWLPPKGLRLRVAIVGAMLVGGYSICYFQAMAEGVTPGILATLLGVQPILTLLAMERRFSPRRLGGLLVALGGLALVVLGGTSEARLPWTGTLFALGALGCMSLGAILQKGIDLSPLEVLPLQYLVGLALCLLALPLQPVRLELTLGLVVPLLWLGLAISVAAQLLFYRMIRSGDLVDVTSLFYLVPVVTAALDYWLLGHPLSASSLVGLAAILFGLILVFRRGRQKR